MTIIQQKNVSRRSGRFLKTSASKLVVSLVLAVITTACSTVTINPDPAMPMTLKEPNYQQSKPYFLVGLVGKHRIDVRSICEASEVLQMQSQRTLADGAFSLLSLGLYTPLTVKVWCL